MNRANSPRHPVLSRSPMEVVENEMATVRVAIMESRAGYARFMANDTLDADDFKHFSNYLVARVNLNKLEILKLGMAVQCGQVSIDTALADPEMRTQWARR